MPLVPVIRLTSGINTQTDSTSRQEAINKAIHKAEESGTTQDSVLIGNVPRLWPELSKYENDTSGGFSPDIISVPPPEFIWDQESFPPGQIKYFAQAFQFDATVEHAVFAAVFADNAHVLYIEERDINGNLVQSFPK